MASFHDSSQSRMMSHRLSNVPSEISRFSQLMSPSTVKQFATWDRVDGSTPVPTVSRISFNCVLKGFALGASLLPSLRAEYKVSKQTVSYLKGIVTGIFSFPVVKTAQIVDKVPLLKHEIAFRAPRRKYHARDFRRKNKVLQF